jgi:hypothetical protein
LAASDIFAAKVESSLCVRTSHDKIVVLNLQLNLFLQIHVVLLQPVMLCLKNADSAAFLSPSYFRALPWAIDSWICNVFVNGHSLTLGGLLNTSQFMPCT